MIGTELLQLLQGDPLAQMRQQMGGPNPNPQAPPSQQAPRPPPAPGSPGQPLSMPAITNVQPHAGPTPPMPQGGPPAPAGAPPPPPALPQSGPPSTAPQSPPDLVQLYGRLMQQQRSGSAIDHGLALMASAYAAPGTQGQIMHSMDNQQQDPSATMSNLVQLQQMQNMQNSRPAIVAALTGGVGDGSSGGIGGLPANVVNSLPTDTLLKMLDQRQQAAIQLQQDQAKSGIAVAQQGTEQKQKDLLEAQDKAPARLQQLGDMDHLASTLDTNAVQSIMSSPVKRAAAMKLLQTGEEAPGAFMTQVAAYGLSGPEQAALYQLKQLNNQVYGQAFESTGSRRTGTEVANLKAGLSQLTDFNQPFDSYMKQFGNFQNQLHKSVANTYGSAGRVDEIPDAMKWDTSDPNNPKPLVDAAYLPNGDKYAGKGGQWASNPPPKQGGGGQPVQIGGPDDIAKLARGTPFVIPSGPNQGKIGYAQ